MLKAKFEGLYMALTRPVDEVLVVPRVHLRMTIGETESGCFGVPHGRRIDPGSAAKMELPGSEVGASRIDVLEEDVLHGEAFLISAYFLAGL